VQTDATTASALSAAVSRQGWCEALSAALGSGYRVVWRDAGDVARVTLTMSGTLPISEQRVHISEQPSAVSCSSGTPTKTLLESADGTRWALLEPMVPLVDSQGAALAPVAGAGFRWVDPLVVQPPVQLSALPAWLQDAPLMTWVPVSSSLITSVTTYNSPGIAAYSGATLRGSQILLAGGGHNDYYGNEVLGLDLLQDDPQWTVVGAGSPTELWEPAVYYYADGKPSPTHTYWTLHWIEQHGRMFRTGGTTAYFDDYVTSPYNDAFDPVTGEWDAGAGASWPNVLSGNSGKGSVFTGDHIWEFAGTTFAGPTGRLLRCDVATMEWTDCGSVTGGHAGDTPVLYDPVRNRLVRPRGDASIDPSPSYFALDGYVSGIPPATNFTFSGPQPASWGGTSMTYCADLDRYLAVKWLDTSSIVYSINPDTFACEVLAVGGTPPEWPGVLNDWCRVYGARWTYVPELRGVLMIHSPQKPAHFFRTA